MAKFLNDPNFDLIGDKKYRLTSSLLYESDLLKCTLIVPAGFETDFSSVPRFIPLVYDCLAERMQRESICHDYLYRKDSIPVVSRSAANDVFLEAMESTDRPWITRHVFFYGVCIGGRFFYHINKVMDPLRVQLQTRLLKKQTRRP